MCSTSKQGEPKPHNLLHVNTFKISILSPLFQNPLIHGLVPIRCWNQPKSECEANNVELYS